MRNDSGLRKSNTKLNPQHLRMTSSAALVKSTSVLSGSLVVYDFGEIKVFLFAVMVVYRNTYRIFVFLPHFDLCLLLVCVVLAAYMTAKMLSIFGVFSCCQD